VSNVCFQSIGPHKPTYTKAVIHKAQATGVNVTLVQTDPFVRRRIIAMMMRLQQCSTVTIRRQIRLLVGSSSQDGALTVA
jgi:hypothetical protein